MNDLEIGRMVRESLTNYFGNNNIPVTEPFYENETTIRAEDETFIFRLAFKFENNNVVFNWEAEKKYPHEEYLERKYECFNCFVVDVFPDHIILFNDFTVQPFVYSKSVEKYCIRTHLRTFIPRQPLQGRDSKVRPIIG